MEYDSCLTLHDPAKEVDWVNVKNQLKPGAHVVSITPLLEHHRVTAAMEDYGIEIRDCVLVLGTHSYMVALGRLPLGGTVAENVLRHGVGALNIANCRVPIDVKADASQLRTINRNIRGGGDGWGLSTVESTRPQVVKEEGRWPANVIVQDDEIIKEKFPFSKSCNSPSSSKPESKYRPGQGNYQPQGRIYPGDSGSASRFFHSVPCEDSLKELTLYLAKLITPPGGKVLVYSLTQSAIIALMGMGFVVNECGENEI
jgi:hypothetical protein